MGAPSAGSSPVNLTVMMPYDQSISTTMTQMAGDYGKNHNTQIKLITVKGRQSIVNEITNGNTTPDLVIIEDKYALFNLSGLGKLEKSGVVNKSTFLCRSNAVLVVPKGSTISNVTGLSGKKVAVVDMGNFHSPGGCLANFIVADVNATYTPVNESEIPQVYKAVANSSADATCIWKSEFDEQQKKTGSDLASITLPQYGMDNYIVLLKSSKNSQEAANFMDYVVAHKDKFTD
jgi:ABC-type molybdate transport system substrate-binding protein